MNALRFQGKLGACAFALLLGACGGGAGTTALPAGGNVPALAKPRGALHVAIKIPKAVSHTHVRTPKYISPSTQSMTIDITGPTPVDETVNLTITSGNCTSTLASTLCEINIPNMGVGSYHATIATYDGTNGSGNVLSQEQNVAFAIKPGLNNAISLTLGGIAASVSVTPLTPYRLTGSTSGFTVYGNAPADFLVTAYDADGNAIVGAGAPIFRVRTNNPRLISAAAVGSASPGEFALTSLYEPSDPQAASLVSVTVVARPAPSSGGSTLSTTVPITLYQPWIYITDTDNNRMVAYDEQGNLKSLAANAFSGLSSPFGIAYDPHNGWLYVAQYSGTVAAFNRTGSSENTFSGVSAGVSVAYDPNNLWLYEIGYNGGSAVYNEAGAQQTTSGNFSGLSGPHQIAFDPQTDWFYVANCVGGGGVTVYDQTGTGITPSGAFSNLPSHATAVAYDPYQSWMYVVGSGGTVSAYDGNANVQLTSTPGNLSTPYQAAFDPYDGWFYVTNESGYVAAFDQQGNETMTSANQSSARFVGIAVVR